mgnify:FL=1
MKIGIDTFGCDHARSGLGTYILSFVSNISSESDVDVELFGSELDRFTYTSGKDIAYKSVNIADSLNMERLWHFTNSSKFGTMQNYDLIIYPAPERVLPISFKVPGIAVVNTILSNVVEGNKDWIQKLQIKRGLLNVQKIIAASAFIRDDLISHGIDKDKIEVVYNGIDHKLFFPAIELNSDVVDIKPFAIKRPYFIYGSRLSGPEKKHIELIKAFSIFKKKTGLPHRLVIAGSDGSYSAEIHKAAFESEFASDIFLTGYFPYESFPQLYSGSDACIFPSVNEGVGLPILEAMATGVPVICSNAGALPEMGQNAVKYFNSDNIEEIASSMELVVNDKELRSVMIEKGLKRAGDFSWKKTVLQTVDIAKKVISI